MFLDVVVVDVCALLLVITVTALGVNASQEFQVYRLQQFDMPFGHHVGSRVNSISMEAKTMPNSIKSSAASAAAVSRKCVLARLDDLTLESYRSLVSNYVGSIIVIVPAKINQTATKQSIRSLEATLLSEEVKIPIYFIPESNEINKFYGYIDTDRSSSSNGGGSAFRSLVDAVAMNGFQFVINAAQSSPLAQSASASSDFQVINIQGKLNGGGAAAILSKSEQLNQAGSSTIQKIPTIILTAHYDAFGMATSLSYGCDSNGSGVVALLELSRIFSKLYSNSKTVPPFNLLFLLTAEGKFNYHGIKKWLEEHSETSEIAGKVDLDDVQFAICLDGIGAASPSSSPSSLSSLDEEDQNNGQQQQQQQQQMSEENALFAHVSRPPKEGQPSFEFLQILEKLANKTSTKYELVHKKINLANEILAWEHERFSLNKLPAMTISHFQSHKDSSRTSMTDTIDSVDPKILVKNIRIILKSLGHYIYKNEELVERLFNGGGNFDVSEKFVASWLDKICHTSRSASLLNKNHPLVANFYSHFNHYMHESIKYPVKVHPKEPEFVLYNEEQATLIIYNVKPAIFDLFLAIMIAGYLGLIYLFVINFGQISFLINRTLLLNQYNNSQNGSKSKTN